MRLGNHLYILTFVFILSFAGSIKSQNPHNSPTYGIKGGLLLSTIDGDNVIDPYAKIIMPQVGITGALFFSPKISVNSELNFEIKGGNFDGYELKTSLNYISIPLFVKFAFSKDPEIYVYGGGYGSYLLSAKTTGTYEKFEVNEKINENIKPNLSAFDAGFIAGVGVQGRFNRKADIFIDFRYCQGLINIDNGTVDNRYNLSNGDTRLNVNELPPEKALNKSFMLTTGMYFYIIKR